MPSVRSGPLAVPVQLQTQLRFWRALALVAVGVCAYLLWRGPASRAANARAAGTQQRSWGLSALRDFGGSTKAPETPPLAPLLAAIDRSNSVQARSGASGGVS